MRAGSAPEPRDERSARQILATIADPSDRDLTERLERVGAVQVVAELRDERSPLRRAGTYSARWPLVDLDQQWRWAEGVGARCVVPADPGWPTALNDLGPQRPFALWARGSLDLATLATRPSIAIVGARAATQYGEGVAVEFAAELSRLGWVVVSGGAYGIDAAAHRGALAVDGDTVAVLANGVDRAYPRGNDALLSRIGNDGLIVTELPPGASPTRAGFLARNRLIAALSRVTLVVEAAARSGSMTTVARAIELGRDVVGVPGPVTSATSAGVHTLLRDGAVLVTEPAHVVELMEPWQVAPDTPAPRDTPRDDLGPHERRILDAFPARQRIAVEELSVRAGLPPADTLRHLGRLDLEGWVERVEGRYRLTAQARGQ